MKFHRMLPLITPWLLSLGLCLYFLEGTIAAQNEVKPLGSGVKPPVVLYMAKPSYTEEARKAKIEGVVLLQLVVRKDGTADSFKVIKGLGYGLDESTISTIASKWRFKPGTYLGVPVDVQINTEVAFRLYSSKKQDTEFKVARAKAEQGDTTAQMQLGKMLLEEKGIPQDFVEAYKWFDIAAANGAEGAAEQRDILAKKMTPDQIAEGQKRSAEFNAEKGN